MDKEIETAKKNGYVKTIMNRKRVIDELKSTNYMIRNMGERMALNTPVQGSASDILKKAMIEIDEIFEKKILRVRCFFLKKLMRMVKRLIQSRTC